MFIYLPSDLKDTSQIADFERESLELPESYIIEKVAGKGLDWCYIGVNWRKLAELG